MSQPRPSALRWSDLWAVVPVLALTWPMWTRSGYGLARDLVFTPRLPFTPDAIGWGSSPARSVPLDAVVATMTSVVDGAVVFRVLVAGALVLAACGASRILPELSTGGRLVAGSFAVWNPYVIERLALGQWALLYGYAALFWLLPAWRRLLAGEHRAGVRCWPLMGIGALVPTGGLLVALGAAASVVAATARRASTGRRVLLLVTLAVLAQLPWLVPSLVGDHVATGSAEGVTAFQSRPERPGGVWLTLVSGGGIWSRYVVPGSLTGRFGHVLGAACLLVVVLSARRLWSRLPEAWVAGTLSLGLAGLAHLPGGAALLGWMVSEVPGGGLLRDGHKWLAPWVVLVVASAAVLASRVERRLSHVEPGLLPATGVVAAVLPLLLVPDATGRTWPALTPVQYPADLEQVVRVLDEAPAGTGSVATLPWTPYRFFPWGNDLSAPDPLPRWTDHDVVVSDVLTTADGPLPGEDPVAAAVGRALAGEDPDRALAEAGVGWLVVYEGARGVDGGVDQERVVDGLERVVGGEAVTLYRVPHPRSGQVRPAAAVTAMAVVDALWAASLILAAAFGVITRRRNRPTRGETDPPAPA